MNKVILIGNLGGDPELRSTQTGTAICNIRLATSEKRKDKDGNYKDFVEWHKVVIWSGLGEAVGKYCSKGSKLCVEGRLQTRKWQDKDGKDQYSTEIVAENVEFLDSKNSRNNDGNDAPAPRRENTEQRGGGGYGNNGGGGGYGRTNNAPRPAPAPSPDPGFGSSDDDIPF